jgi:hypothetical protein
MLHGILFIWNLCMRWPTLIDLDNRDTSTSKCRNRWSIYFASFVLLVWSHNSARYRSLIIQEWVAFIRSHLSVLLSAFLCYLNSRNENLFSYEFKNLHTRSHGGNSSDCESKAARFVTSKLSGWASRQVEHHSTSTAISPNSFCYFLPL